MTTLGTPAGLRGVVVSDTSIGDVRGTEGFYHYRQYSAVDLARGRTFEDACHLVLEGRLPSTDERAAFLVELAERRTPPEAVRAVLPALARAGTSFHPLTGLQAALAVLAADQQPTWGSDPARRREDALAVCALTPTVLAALHRLRSGLEPVEPREDLHGAAMWLHLLSGTEPEPRVAAALEPYLVATIDHGFNASTFTARVAASAGADVASSVVAAISTFTGPLHGGAPDRALDALDEIGTEAGTRSNQGSTPIGEPDHRDRADAWVRARLAAGERIMGFGHAVYRTADPRAVMLREVARGLRDRDPALVDLATTVEARVEAVLAERHPDRELHTNVEFWAGVVMSLCGVPRSMFTPTFAVSRVVGWSAHVLEQAAAAKLIRPAARYVGPSAPEPVPA